MKNIFFDLDGTLIDDTERQFNCYKHTLSKLNLESNIIFNEYKKLKQSSLSNKEIFEYYFPISDKNNEFNELFVKNIENINFLYQDKLFEKAVDCLQSFKKKNKIYLITNRQNSIKLNLQIKFFKINHYFESIILSRSFKDKRDAIVFNGINISKNDIFISDNVADFNNLNTFNILVSPNLIIDKRVTQQINYLNELLQLEI
jgi:phosphoglycolate phosphatase-like HAD superfamily hydrolase